MTGQSTNEERRTGPKLSFILPLIGFLILALGALRTHRLELRRTLIMAGVWVAIFGIVVLFVDAVS